MVTYRKGKTTRDVYGGEKGRFSEEKQNCTG